MEVNANFGSRYIGAIREGDDASGSIEVVGVPAPGVGTIELIGPAALAASGELEITGTGVAASGTASFVGVPAPGVGAVEAQTNGEAASIFVRIFGGQSVSTANITLTSDGTDGNRLITFEDGDQAEGTITYTGISVADGVSIQILNTGVGTGVPQVTELYTARTTPAAANDFQAGLTDAALETAPPI